MEEYNSDTLQTYVHSEELHDILGKPPGKFIKYGIIVCAIVTVMLVAVCLIIQYPESERGECIIYADPAPKPVVTVLDGKLDTIFVSEGEIVAQNQPLGIIKNPARYNRVLQLDSVIHSCLINVQTNNFDKILITPSSSMGIGELQGHFQHLYWNYMQIRAYIYSPLFKQIKINSAIGQQPAAENQNKVFQEFQKSFFDLMANFVNAINDLNAAISLWKEKYLITAPAGGAVVFPTVVFKNQEITAGKIILYIDPPSKRYYAQITLPQESHHKVKIHQPVIINLPGSSHNQVQGHVSNTSRIIDKEGNFTVKVALDAGQTDSLGQLVDVRSELRGTGSIITNRRSLLAKILGIGNK